MSLRYDRYGRVCVPHARLHLCLIINFLVVQCLDIYYKHLIHSRSYCGMLTYDSNFKTYYKFTLSYSVLIKAPNVQPIVQIS